eukprot:CAMPEP_0179412678 /NCGR_PEP_ID=MMETSP0799-20121207/4611_1 /TAXON_ID=46947 /ORGANISM="Geminigera cryophila, Strain CCMP2564" /LENGTH=185 /DNA_ID=CAMNT_0021184935 /DNA_START=87 /DNA_END=641 /DNA_ORIENTATION=-
MSKQQKDEEVDSSYDGPDSDASSEEFFDPANQGQQGLGKDGVYNIQQFIDHKLVDCSLPDPSKSYSVRLDLCSGNRRSTLIKISGNCSNLVVTRCSNIMVMVDQVSTACTVTECKHVSILVRGNFPSPLTIRSVEGVHFTCGHNNIHSSVSVSRGFGLEVHGIIKAGQPEPPFAAVSKRMPVDVW